MAATSFQFHGLSEAQMQHLASDLSLWAVAGDVILLQGEVGAGKSTFARSFIRALNHTQKDFDIPSPSFALVQIYDNIRVPVAHVDLYRLQSADEIAELGLSELAQSHVLLVEWPERLPEQLFTQALHIAISGAGATRKIDMTAPAAWGARLQRDRLIRQFLERNDLGRSHRQFLEGDASSRRYETLSPHSILMDMPKRPDGPVVQNGLPYSAIVHLAEDISAVVAVNDYLVAQGYSAPKIQDVDLEHGFAVIENLGAQAYGRMLLQGHDMQEPLSTAVELLADMARQSWPDKVMARHAKRHHVQPYDGQAMLAEADLLPGWYWPQLKGSRVSEQALAEFHQLWRNALAMLETRQLVWVLRDFHSPNLLWLPERQGIKRVGLIDTQDAVMGHPAYDLVSLLQDARVDVPPHLASQLYESYIRLRCQDSIFDPAAFQRDFAILGAQRATKILGIFARLNQRDGKPHYLRHIPRVAGHLWQNLSHPSLEPLRRWYEQYVPPTLANAP